MPTSFDFDQARHHGQAIHDALVKCGIRPVAMSWHHPSDYELQLMDIPSSLIQQASGVAKDYISYHSLQNCVKMTVLDGTSGIHFMMRIGESDDEEGLS